MDEPIFHRAQRVRRQQELFCAARAPGGDIRVEPPHSLLSHDPGRGVGSASRRNGHADPEFISEDPSDV